MVSTTFIYPVFTEHLNSKFGLSIEASSVFFVISMISYFITIQYLNKLSVKLGVKLTIALGLMINFIALPFLAPVGFLPQSLVTVVIGLIVLGSTGACVTIPSIIDFMTTMKNKMGMDETVANDISSGKS
jgi:fucose permease